ncbi:costars family protein ABRACL-like isoform X1 [Mytilus trossulus]|uniref:costars family protein ABRACL-like isoform X1 n=2 Tax=Mytilus trossulus TaxID=6551 RepID=UPI003005FB56
MKDRNTVSSERSKKMDVNKEIGHLIDAIQRLGTENSDKQHEVTFGVLFNDDDCANLFEAMVGTLRAAKRKKIITYDGELLLQGVHDNVKITLLKTEV